MPEIITHPTAQALALFGHGKLSDAQAATVAAHLETCAACSIVVAGLAPDSFLGKVRAAKPGGTVLPPRPSPARPAASPSIAGRPPAPSAPLANVPPELANHPKFRIVRELGRGGMGVIYLAEHRVMEKHVALKVINPAVLDNPDALARFRAEVKAAGQLDHQNVARAFDADQAGDLHFLVMEFVAGLTLAQVLERRGPLPAGAACHLVSQAAQGLQHAFERGMAHRDIKPQNLMVTPKGLVKVLDFGLARVRSERKAAPRLTQLESFMGTPEYVAPEQATDARSADTRADIYSLGCTLYALLTGRPPFVEDTVVKLILAHVEKEPQPLHELRPDVPPELSAVVGKMLAKDPAQRYQTPVEVARALAPFVKAGAKAGTGGGASLPPGVASAKMGTRVGGDTSRVKGPGQGESKRPDKALAAGEKEGSPFGDLMDAPAAAPAPKKAKKERKEAKPVSAAWWKRPAVLAGAGVAVLLLAVVIPWAAGVFRVKTADGSILVIEVNEPNADVFVDGEKVSVTWDKGGKKAEIRAISGTSKVELKKDGFTVSGEKVEIRDGKRVLTVTLIPAPTKKPPPPADKSASSKRFKAEQRGKRGKWLVVDDHLEQTSFEANVVLCFGDPAWTDYDFAVDVMQGEGNDQVCQLFRWESGKGAYFYGLGHAGNTVYTIESSVYGKNTRLLPDVKGHIDQGKWYTMLVRVRGRHAQCLLNGDKLFDFESDERPSGSVGLRTWGTQYRFRNIKVTTPDGTVLLEGLPDLKGELPDKAGAAPAAGDKDFVPLFNGKNLDGWQTQPTKDEAGSTLGTRNPDAWSVRDGVLIGRTGDYACLRTERADFSDFHLRVEALVAGGSGSVYFRWPTKVKNPGPFEIPICTTGRWQTGSLLRKTLRIVECPWWSLKEVASSPAPANTWVTLEAIAVGDRIVVKVNGETTADVRQPDGERSGYVSLYAARDSTLQFRKIEIKELLAK